MINLTKSDKDDIRFYIKYLKQDDTVSVTMEYFRTKGAAIYNVEKRPDFKQLLKLYPKELTDFRTDKEE